MHGLKTWGYKTVGYHGIWVPRYNFYYVLFYDWIGIWKYLLNSVNRIEHLIIEPKKMKGKRSILAFSPNIRKDRKYGIFLGWGSFTYSRERVLKQTRPGLLSMHNTSNLRLTSDSGNRPPVKGLLQRSQQSCWDVWRLYQTGTDHIRGSVGCYQPYVQKLQYLGSSGDLCQPPILQGTRQRLPPTVCVESAGIGQKHK